jgi:Cytochrome b5-like Heme/Steroid binding domain
MKEYTLAEVATHTSREDLFIIIKDEVYEVSKFLAEVSFVISNLFGRFFFGSLTLIS